MGKLPVAKTKKDRPKLGTKVKRELVSSVKKNVCRGYQKRLTMLRRRISVLLDEKDSWEANNRELIDKFNTEKKLNAELQKEIFEWKRLYHEAIISQNTYKVKHAETVQNVSSCLKDIKTAFPHLVGLSDTICRNQIRLTNLLNTSHTLEAETHLPRAFGDGRQSSNDLSKKSDKRMKHKVGPMVNGVLIQKPTIRLERVMLHQPQGQGPTNNDLTPERGNVLSPIVEETEQEVNLHLKQISMRRMRKHRLGTGERWRLRKQQEQLEKERQMERERERENQHRTVTESSDSEDQLGPVIRLQRVSGLLLSPNLLEVDRGRSSEGKGAASRSAEPEGRRLRTGEDPKEGCSWMHLNPVLSKKKSSEKRKPESSATSDEESDSLNVVAEEKVRNSLSDSLYKNKTFSMKRKTSSSSSAADTSRDASESSKVEPDSTNNIDDVVFARASLTSDSLATNTSSVSDTILEERRKEYLSNSRTSSETTLLATDPTQSSRDPTLSSSFCNNCTPITSPEVQGKRIRKPKIHFYPGEEPGNSGATAALVSKVKKAKPAMSSSSVKVLLSQLPAGRKTIGKRLSKNSLESASSSDVTDRRSSKGRPSGIPQKKKIGKPKKSSLKTSEEVTRTSVDQTISQDDEESYGRNSRRNRGPISYKEPSVNVKMRRLK